MTYSYYPGCTLKTKAKELDQYARKSAEALGITLEEVPEWQCCGAVYPMAKDEIASKLSSVRILASAKAAGQDLITVCSACHNVIKRVNMDILKDDDMSMKVNNYLKLDEPYEGETKVIHYLEMLRDVVGFDELKKKVVNPLTGRKIGAYYGCLLLRPSEDLRLDDPENPTIIEEFIKALGATPVIYSQRNECCSAYVALEDKNLAQKRSDAIIGSAIDAQADSLITACPLCKYNLEVNSKENKLPIYYFTELLAEALGVK